MDTNFPHLISRCNLSGHDLNRAYPEPDATLHPEICTVKKLARELSASHRLALFLDMHGHSSKKGFFLYCCDESVAAFPGNIQKRSAFYAMDNTTFTIGKAKATTGKAALGEGACAHTLKHEREVCFCVRERGAGGRGVETETETETETSRPDGQRERETCLQTDRRTHYSMSEEKRRISART